MKEPNVDLLRSLVRNYLERHHYEAAVFWADKVVSFSKGDPIDVYWLVQAYISTEQYHRASLLIYRHNLYGNGTLCYLAAYCHFKAGQYQEAINLLEAPKWPVVSPTEKLAGVPSTSSIPQYTPGFRSDVTHKAIPQLDDVVSLESSRQLLRARIYEATDNPNLANECYKAALLADPYCFDALKALTSHYMLSIQEETELMDSIPLDVLCESKAQGEFLMTCYQTTLNKCSSNACQVPDTSLGSQSPGLAKPAKIRIDLDELPSSVTALSNNLDILTARAENLYYKCKFAESYYLTKRVLDLDPYHIVCLPTHIACLIEMHQPIQLFRLAHRLVELYPESALAWFAVGCYYYLIEKNELARRYLSKATTLDKSFGPAWIAFAHSFAAENEHDQASAAYFKASQLMKGCHLPLLYIGMEYSLGNNPKFAEKFFLKSLEMAPNDPFVLHEIGVVAFNSREYETSEKYLREAVSAVEHLYGIDSAYYNIPNKWYSLYNNLGHCLRKRGKYVEAVDCHHQAARLMPDEASTYTAIALCYGITGQLEEAIEALHNSLSLQRDQTVATTLLNTLMLEQVSGKEDGQELLDKSLESIDKLRPRKEDPRFGSKQSYAATPGKLYRFKQLRRFVLPTKQSFSATPGTSNSLTDKSVLESSSSLTIESSSVIGDDDDAAVGDTPNSSTDMLESSSVMSATSPPPVLAASQLSVATPTSLAGVGPALGDSSVGLVEDMVLDDDSD